MVIKKTDSNFVFLVFYKMYYNLAHVPHNIAMCMGCAWVINGVDWTIGFIDASLYNLSLKYKKYSTIANLYNFQFTVAHTLGFSVSTSRILVTDLNTWTLISNHYEVCLSFLLQSPSFLTVYSSVLICTLYYSSVLQRASRYIDAARTT
jgi:hypothetical protein